MAVYFSDRNSLNLIQRDHVGRAIIELGGARALVRSHSLGVLERSAGVEVGGNARRTKGVTADLYRHVSISHSAADHAPDIDTVHGKAGECARLAKRRPEEGSAALTPDP